MASRISRTIPALAIAMASPAMAQTAPSAGTISGQVLNRQQATVQAPAARSAPADPAPAASDAGATAPPIAPGVRVTLAAVTFDASRFLTKPQLAAIAAPYLGHQVGAAELDAIVAAVNALYDRRGLVTARALLAPDAVSGGTLHVTLVEGRVGAVTVAGNRRLPAQRAIDRAGLVAGDTLDLPVLRHRLALLNRADDTQMRVSLKPGEQFGLTDIELSVIAPPANVVQLFGDNDGYDSAGRYEGSAYYRRTGILGASDRFTGYFSGSAGLLSGTASYDAPLLGDTSRLGVAYGRSRIDIVDGTFAGLRSRGLTESSSINYSRPLTSSETGILTGSLTAGISATRNYLGELYLGHTRTHRVGAGLSYAYAAPGTSVYVAVNGLYANAPVGGRSDKSDFAVFSGTGSAEHLFGALTGVRLAGGWQVATASYLPSDLLFQIGGANTVRGYRQGELTGDGGYYLNLEAELFPLRAAKGSLTVFGFLDQGRVFSVLDGPKSLSAAGVGAAAGLGRHMTFRATAGMPLQRVADEAKRVQVFGRVGLAF